MLAIAEILVDSSICLAEGTEKLELKHPSDEFEVTITNNESAGPFARNALRAEMVFEVESLDFAWGQALDNMAILLNALCRATGARFFEMTVVKAFDWTPGLIDREARYYATQRASLSHAHLDEAFAKTAERLMYIHEDEPSQSVMRWYRLGRRADNPEEQFMYLWFAVEIAAGVLKETGKIGHACPKCGTDLYCPTCEETPTRRRFETEAIKDLICSVAPADADHDELYKVLSKIRNTLQHGRRLHSIIDELPCTEDQALTALANIAWRATTRLADETLDPIPDQPLTLALIEDIPNKTMVLSTHVTTQLIDGDPNHPDFAYAPNAEIDLIIDEKHFTFDGAPLDQ